MQRARRQGESEGAGPGGVPDGGSSRCKHSEVGRILRCWGEIRRAIWLSKQGRLGTDRSEGPAGPSLPRALCAAAGVCVLLEVMWEPMSSEQRREGVRLKHGISHPWSSVVGAFLCIGEVSTSLACPHDASSKLSRHEQDFGKTLCSKKLTSPLPAAETPRPVDRPRSKLGALRWLLPQFDTFILSVGEALSQNYTMPHA